MKRFVAVASGKGGVGKTHISTNLAVCLGGLGYRTCLFDADLGLANVDILLGLRPTMDLSHVIEEGRPLSQILIQGPQGMDIIPGSSGVQKIADLDENGLARLTEAFSELGPYDFFFFDTSAGISKNVVSFCMSAREVILVITPEPTSLTDGYALVKTLVANGFQGTLMVVVNQAKDVQNARGVYARFKNVVKKYLDVSLQPLGGVLKDPHVAKAVKEQKPFLSLYPDAIASRCIRALARNLVERSPEEAHDRGLDTFWAEWQEVFQGPMKLPVSRGNKQEAPQREETREEAEPAVPGPAQGGAVPEEGGGKPSSVGRVEGPLAEVVPLLRGILEEVSVLSREVAAIRQSVAERGKTPTPLRTPQTGSVSQLASIIPLDFEAYARVHARPVHFPLSR